MDYTARSVSVNYSSTEDRIQWISRCDGDIYIRAWITRRFLDIIMPRIADWIIKRNVHAGATVSTVSGDIIRKMAMGVYEHELAQRQVETVRETIPLMKIVDEFLVDSLVMSMSPNGYVNMSIAAPKDRIKLKFQISMPQVHRIMGELVRLAEASGWCIPDPWKAFDKDSCIISSMIIN